jgi:hypothetical protein
MGAFMKTYLLSAALLAVAAPVSATTPLNVAVGASARAIVGTSDIFFSGQFPAAWSGPGALDINYVAVAGDETYNVTATISVSANWLSAEAGTIEIDWDRAVSGVAASVVTVGAGTNEAPDIDGFPANWFYEFTATGDGFFQGTYEVTGSGATFGLWPLYLTGGSSFLELGGDVDDPSGAGSFSIPLVAGQTYRMILWNNGNIGTDSRFDFTGSASGSVAWEIVTRSVIPEPGTWAMLIAGFGLVGAAARRRKPAAA